MRTEDHVYWSTSLPKDHEALQSLDEFCRDWGGLTRAEATRRILIEWDRLRRGKDIAAWGPNATTRLAASVPQKEMQPASGVVQKPHISNMTARAASQVLDD